MDLTSSNWAWLVAAAAALAAGWGTIRSFISYCSTALIGTLQDDDSAYMRRATEYFLWNKCTRVPLGGSAVVYRTTPLTVGGYAKVVYETIPPSPVLFFYGWVPLVVQLVTTGSSNSPGRGERVVIRYLKGTLSPSVLFCQIDKAYHEFIYARRFTVKRVVGNSRSTVGIPQDTTQDIGEWSLPYQPPLSHKPHELGISTCEVDLARLSLHPECRQAVEELREWYRSRDWYRERGIPWRRGWLLYGNPGTGKSTLAKAVGAALNIPIYQFDLSSLDNPGMISEWGDMLSNTPCVALLEDLDAVFNKRENLAKTITGGLTFDCLLNCISGVGSGDGVVTIITTNDLSRVDSAIVQLDGAGQVSRPGRVDRVLRLDGTSMEGRHKIARQVLGGMPGFTQDTLDALVSTSSGDSVAQFTEKCVRLALKSKYGG